MEIQNVNQLFDQLVKDEKSDIQMLKLTDGIMSFVYFEQIRPPYRSNKATLTMIPVHLCAVEGHRLSL